MAAIVKGEIIKGVSVELRQLQEWGYVTFDGHEYQPTDAGKKAFETWDNMMGDT